MGKKTLAPIPMLLSNSEIRVKLYSLYVFLSAVCLQCFMREKHTHRGGGDLSGEQSYPDLMRYRNYQDL